MADMDLLVDGVSVRSEAFNIVDRSSGWTVAPKRGDNPTLPGQHGAVHSMGKPYDQNAVVWTMWALGCNPDGSMPDGDRRDVVQGHLDSLTRMFSQPGLRTVVATGLPGGSRQFGGEVVSAIDMSSMAGGTRAEFGVEWQLPDPFWYSTDPVTQRLMMPGNVATTLEFGSFDGSTAPFHKGVITVEGPVSNPTLSSPQTGQSVTYTGTVAAGQEWVLDLDRWVSRLGTTNVLGQTTHLGGVRWVELGAVPGGYPIRLSGSGMSTATAVTLSGRKAFLIA